MRLTNTALISKNVTTDKYMCAKYLDMPVLKDDFLVESFAASKFLPFDPIFHTKAFHNLKLGVLGFDASKEEAIERAIQSQDGIVVLGIENLKKEADQLHLLIIH